MKKEETSEALEEWRSELRIWNSKEYACEFNIKKLDKEIEEAIDLSKKREITRKLLSTPLILEEDSPKQRKRKPSKINLISF